jgi:hypothetical protein
MVFAAIVLGETTVVVILKSFIVRQVTDLLSREKEAEANIIYNRTAIDSIPQNVHTRIKHRNFYIPSISQSAKYLKRGGISITGRSDGNYLSTDTRRTTIPTN